MVGLRCDGFGNVGHKSKAFAVDRANDSLLLPMIAECLPG